MKTAFVLSGGGSKGSFQVGVMQSLLENGIAPDAIYGTSVGALNAAGYAYGGIVKLTNQWLAIRGKGDILSRNWLKGPWAKGLYNLNPLKKKLRDIIIGKPNCTAVVTAVDLKTGSVVYADNSRPHDEFINWVLASSTIPFFMEPVNGYVDGGVREQTPLLRAINDGCTKIVLILCNPLTIDPTQSWQQSWPYPLSIGMRSLDIMEHEIFITDIDACIKNNNRTDKKRIDLTVFAPNRLLIDTLEFDPPKIRMAIEQGRKAVML